MQKKLKSLIFYLELGYFSPKVLKGYKTVFYTSLVFCLLYLEWMIYIDLLSPFDLSFMHADTFLSPIVSSLEFVFCEEMAILFIYKLTKKYLIS